MSISKIDPYEAARVYWEELHVDQRNYLTVARQLKMDAGKKSVLDKIGNILRNFERAGHVRHSVARPDGASLDYSPLAPHLEDELRGLTGLRDVLVVDVTFRAEPSENANHPSWSEYDDFVHQQLGIWGARILVSILRKGDVVGTGGGRAPHYTAENCLFPDSSEVSPRTVVSLTGSMSTTVWAKPGLRSSRELDADNVALLLKGGLKSSELPRLLNRPITDKRTVVDAGDVTVILTGIGALAGGHRLRLPHGHGSELAAVKKTVLQLNDAVDMADPTPDNPPFLHWVGDVCNYYFVVDEPILGPSSKRLSRPIRDRVRRAVEALNRQFVNTSPALLADVCNRGAVLAVGGGPHKVASIAHVLRQKPPWISHLVTDSKTAVSVLKLLNQVQIGRQETPKKRQPLHNEPPNNSLSSDGA